MSIFSVTSKDCKYPDEAIMFREYNKNKSPQFTFRKTNGELIYIAKNDVDYLTDLTDEYLIERFPFYKPRMGRSEIGEGWYQIAYSSLKKIEELSLDYEVIIIKEKFGGLDIQGNGKRSEELYDIINDARSISHSVCEKCGHEGTIRKEGWVQTLCDQHHKDYLQVIER